MAAFSCRDPIPVPEKVRKPLTQVQQFNLHVDNRAVDRSEFDHKVKLSVYPLHFQLHLLGIHGLFSTH